MSEDAHTVRRTPPILTGYGNAPLPVSPEPREHLEVTLIGGPFHGEKRTVWTEIRNLSLPMAQSAESPKPTLTEAQEVDNGQGGKTTVVSTTRRLVEPGAIFAVYTRESEDSTEARFSDYSLED